MSDKAELPDGFIKNFYGTGVLVVGRNIQLRPASMSAALTNVILAIVWPIGLASPQRFIRLDKFLSIAAYSFADFNGEKFPPTIFNTAYAQ